MGEMGKELVKKLLEQSGLKLDDQRIEHLTPQIDRVFAMYEKLRPVDVTLAPVTWYDPTQFLHRGVKE